MVKVMCEGGTNHVDTTFLVHYIFLRSFSVQFIS